MTSLFENDGLDAAYDTVQKSRSRISPKRPPTEKAGLADALPYYAGFSFDWSCWLLAEHGLGKNSVVLDPWNGSGTTTTAASVAGYRSVGVDLNPVATLLARLRTSEHLISDLSDSPKGHRNEKTDDPLRLWFDQRTCNRIRDWTLPEGVEAADRALRTVAIFRAVRGLTTKFQGSNPTWVRRSSELLPPVSVDSGEVDALVQANEKHLRARLAAMPKVQIAPLLVEADVRTLPMKENSADFVLTSPPYLTRIDYGVAFSRELAILGVNVFSDRQIRERLMGTTLIRPRQNADSNTLSTVAADLLRAIRGHASKASSGYYLKQAQQYLDDLSRGLQEIDRVAKPSATVVLVVQDSFYKDVHVRLADICESELARLGWKAVQRDPFPVIRSLTTLNTAARAYSKGRVDESVITLRKE